MNVERSAVMRRVLLILGLAAACGIVVAAATYTVTILPSGWRLTPSSSVAKTGTMPDGIALSPDGTRLAVVEAGLLPAALRILRVPDLSLERTVPLQGAFGKPVWQGNDTVWVAGGGADAVFAVDAASGEQKTRIAIGKGSWPAAVALAPDGATIATANDENGTASIANARSGALIATFDAGSHPSDVALTSSALYVASRGDDVVRAIRLSDRTTRTIRVGRHPAALALSADGRTLYVAASDDDAVQAIDVATNTVSSTTDVGIHDGRAHGAGSLPNGLAVSGAAVYATLGGANAVAVIRDGRVASLLPTGWYPTGVAPAADGSVYVADGKGEGTTPNPQFNPFTHHREGYVAALTVGSVRRIEPSAALGDAVVANIMPQWTAPPDDRTVIRPHGPIEHVIYIIKENRSYDQVLGDIKSADGDPSLVWFGKDLTPNQHAIALRFGVFDRAFTNSQVSADGHNWTDAAIANDYVERFWPVNYGGRRNLYDFQSGTSPDVPHNGYLWDAAARAGITYRDYGEDTNLGPHDSLPVTTDFPGLQGHFDPRYPGWSLTVPDLTRYLEWKREFTQFVHNGKLPALEIVYFPNDHTSGTRAGAWTPQAYVAENDLVVGKLVDQVSHSRYWKSTAIFILEDDAQNGPDHVSDQRSTFYVASPYARGGVDHTHYSTAAVVHTIELVLGLQPLSLYDTTALPMYSAFDMKADVAPYTALAPRTSLNARNAKTAYGAAISAKLNWSEPDEVNPAVLNDILAHAVHAR